MDGIVQADEEVDPGDVRLGSDVLSGEVVVGATVEDVGFDTTVRAGAVRELLRDARAVLPVIDEYELVETLAALRPGSPDNTPMIGPAGIDGLIVATGHYRNGILLAPITAEIVAALVTSAPPPVDARPFSPLRG